jgi:hypothetical protein
VILSYVNRTIYRTVCTGKEGAVGESNGGEKTETLCWLCGIGLVMWHCAGYVTLCWLCDTVLVMWHCAGYVALCWLCDTVLVMWHCVGYVALCWLCGTVLVI